MSCVGWCASLEATVADAVADRYVDRAMAGLSCHIICQVLFFCMYQPACRACPSLAYSWCRGLTQDHPRISHPREGQVSTCHLLRRPPADGKHGWIARLALCPGLDGSPASVPSRLPGRPDGSRPFSSRQVPRLRQRPRRFRPRSGNPVAAASSWLAVRCTGSCWTSPAGVRSRSTEVSPS